ncbi:hypothetical protein U9M48_041271 [Paspalum notatum var. saurae]|uniref:Uncharacterized protein n=1 Tax=Paspalum notatum var. saurae TaxID=547442 RepID=A0AAQ3XE11_PASNO
MPPPGKKRFGVPTNRRVLRPHVRSPQSRADPQVCPRPRETLSATAPHCLSRVAPLDPPEKAAAAAAAAVVREIPCHRA